MLVENTRTTRDQNPAGRLLELLIQPLRAIYEGIFGRRGSNNQLHEWRTLTSTALRRRTAASSWVRFNLTSRGVGQERAAVAGTRVRRERRSRG
jgi:hypothetical protein